MSLSPSFVAFLSSSSGKLQCIVFFMSFELVWECFIVIFSFAYLFFVYLISNNWLFDVSILLIIEENVDKWPKRDDNMQINALRLIRRNQF